VTKTAAAVAAALALLVVNGCGARAYRAQAPAFAESSAVAAGRAFLGRYATADGRVQRIDQGGDTVGESQAYGMLVAAGIGDEPRFATIWAWTQRHLQRPDGLLAFRWVDGRIVDPQAATDADLDASRALLVAGCRFHRPDLRRQATGLGEAVLGHETTSDHGRLLLTAGPWATGDPVTLNPGYVAPATLEALARASGDARFDRVAAAGRTLVGGLSRPLPPDWASVSRAGSGVPQPSGPPHPGGGGPLFSFDAARTLVRFAEDPQPAGRQVAAGAWRVFRGQAPDSLIVEHTLSGRPAGTTHHPIVLVAAAGAATAAGSPHAAARLLDAAADLDRRQPSYYGSAWVALGRLMLQTGSLDSCA